MKPWLQTVLVAGILSAIATAACTAQTPAAFPGKKTVWNGYDRYDFVVDGRNCLDADAWQRAGWRVYALGRSSGAPHAA